MEQVRLGIIGIGGMGTEHAKGLLAGKVPEIRLTAVADIRLKPLLIDYPVRHVLYSMPKGKQEHTT